MKEMFRSLKFGSVLLLAACSWVSLGQSTSLPQSLAEPAVNKEYQVKAVFLFNFAQFVEWPAEAFPNALSPLVIGVLGEDPFGSYLDEVIHGEKAHRRPLVVQRYQKVEEIKACHILFVRLSEAKPLAEILDGLKGRSILTVGDVEGFARGGGMIRFVNETAQIRFRINLEAAKGVRLTISSKLLRSAEIVTPGKD